MKKFLKEYYMLLFVILFGIILRFYQLSSIPISLNHDETAIGYNAYSILKTGADEYGKFIPLSLQSFGDWKLPVYPLLDIIPIIFFDLSEFAVRLPSAIAGVIAIPLLYILAYQLFQSKRISLFAAFFIAVSPWGVFFSRIAYEANVATTMLITSVICFLQFYLYKRTPKWLIPSALLLGLTIFTYHAFVVFAPIFGMGLLILILRKKKLKNKWVIFSLIIFAFFIVLSVFATITGGSLNKLSSTSLFDDQHMLNERVNIFRGDQSSESVLSKKLLHNNISAVGYQIGQNYLATYSPYFLFDRGGEKFLHNIGNFGNFYILDALFLVVGVLALFWKREKNLAVLVLWLILGPIPSSITIDSPSSTRLFLMLPVFIIIIAYGVNFITVYFQKKTIVNISVKTVLCLLFIWNFVYFVDAYYGHMNLHKAQYFHYGYKEAVELANKYPTYDVVMYDPTNFPYISFLFYNKYDPARFRQEVEYYPENFGPFHYVKSFGRYRFVDNIDYENLKPKTLYIDYRGIREEDFKIVDPKGDAVFKYFFKED